MSEPEAIRKLERAGYMLEKGIIKAPRDELEPKKFKQPTTIEADAINYLCDEWDYSFEDQ